MQQPCWNYDAVSFGKDLSKAAEERLQKLSKNKAGGMPKQGRLVKSLGVKLTSSPWPAAGVANGRNGTVKMLGFLQQPNPGQMPDFVVIDLPGYCGPPWPGHVELGLPPTCIPVGTEKADFLINGKSCSRRMIPLAGSVHVTFHAAQGQTWDGSKYVVYIDLGKKPRIFFGRDYVGMTRATAFSSMIFIGRDGAGPSMSRFMRLRTNKQLHVMLLERLAYKRQLAEIEKQTIQTWLPILQALHVLTSTTEYDIASWQEASASILKGTADEQYGGSRTSLKESVHSASEQCSNDALPSVLGFVVQRDFMTGATKEVDTDWIASSQFGATKDGDAEGMQPEDGTCMAR